MIVDTITGGLRLTKGLRWLGDTVPARWHQNRYVRSVLSDAYSVLSYVHDWQQAFCQSPLLKLTTCNINNLLEFRACLRTIKNYDLIVILHSAAGDDMSFVRGASAILQARRGKLLVFFGNEYNLMPEKIGFARETGADYIASQLPQAAARWLYSECPSHVLEAPPALNPEVYRPIPGPRPIDIGFRGDAYRLTLGDTERTDLINYFSNHSPRLGLVTDIEFVRYHRRQWVIFLNQCKGIVGAESGTYYLEKDDRTQQAIAQYVRQVPESSFEDIYTRFFKGYPNPVSGKAVSSRHFEPIGTKTCQILLEGNYNGILKADEHYISIKKDFSNVAEALQRFHDHSYRQHMVNRAHDYVFDQHTYGHRVESLLRAIC
ncbi:MAG: glycosyltransferase family protein [Nitrospiraceae bacterium]